MMARTEMARMFVRAGFTLARKKNHRVWNCPCGHAQIVCPVTPSGRRANTQADIRRTLRACRAQKEIA